MKRLFFLCALLLGTVVPVFAADHRVNVSDMEFTPRVVNAVVGDTITYVLASGATGHNVASVTIPDGARPWESPVDAEHHFRIASGSGFNLRRRGRGGLKSAAG